jgi:hypothetical protein
MKRYNFDTVPKMASGFAVHAKDMREARKQAKALANQYGYKGGLVFRNNDPCQWFDPDYKCEICNPHRR